MNEVLDEGTGSIDAPIPDAGPAFETVHAWLAEPSFRVLTEALSALAARAADHPIVAIVAILSVLAALFLVRSVLVLVAVSFFAIAAVAGTEPVMDGLARAVFPVGCFLSLVLIMAHALSQRRRIDRLERDAPPPGRSTGRSGET
ncbi:hypothetical protein U0C82_00195 [Fulvimarina sp. 2208YS6-2-32]|uniref:Holin-X, holin superfamily III n=1 Tax=Fulvimarina uroteuthidis TaxID=3098149 RepID=A0ABU5HWP6_9HYPH|nr:hypothetical protein [Fulvimarina sp. 2208YS6-2-32]MDY8107566.1 hypothetical protein [Fulvimarina sp. 2208YS6-2-32]